MGWTFYNSYNYKNGKVDRKAECDSLNTWDNESSKGKILKSTMRGSVYYAALEITNKKENDSKVVGIVYLTSSDLRNGYNFGYKDMDESELPGYYDCPLNIIDLLSPTNNELAIEWRNKCIEQRKKPKSWLKELKIGDSIIYTTPKGDKVRLIKHAPAYQFKTWFWLDTSTFRYVKKSVVNENNAELYIA